MDKDLRESDIIMMAEFVQLITLIFLKCGDKNIFFNTAKAKFCDEFEEILPNTK